jgi:cobalamin biosynthesis Co2+ chelatase CbiK
MAECKKALLVVSFGTSHADTKHKTIDQIENYLSAAMSDRILYRAWTSGMIIKKLRERDGIVVPTVDEAITSMLNDGITDLLVQPTHVLNGIENDIMIENITAKAGEFSRISFSAPLLTADADISAVVAAIGKEYAYIGSDAALILMGHGTSHYTNPVYAALDYRFKEMGFPNIYVGTVEAYPSAEHVLGLLKARPEIRRVVLAPFMIVAGDHAKNDMSGPDDNSWRSLFENAGYQVQCILKGLGEYESIRNIFVSHALAAVEKECAE